MAMIANHTLVSISGVCGCGDGLFDAFEKTAQCPNVLLPGMVDYCPPEVFTDPLYHAVPTNVWSLGVLLYEIMNDCALPFLTSTDITQAEVTFQNSSISEGE